MKINCIAIDDEPLALEKIREYIRRIGYLNLLQCFDNAVDAMEYMKTANVELVFLDVQMEELSGIQMLESLHERPKVVLTTAYDEYALKGYELEVCDYLLKPISFQRFLQACEKVYDQLFPVRKPDISIPEPGSTGASKGYFFVKNGNITQKINFEDILFVEGMKDYLRIWTTRERVMTLLSFKKIEEVLPPTGFIRIHKSYLVALNKIDCIEHNHVIIGNEKLPIGDTYRKEFLKIIGGNKIN
ncbi:MAG: response regulator transcription factor [Bacteroidales bacterium]|nr:response regulator transcription factor [Bacteroidales bacterium]